MKFLFIVAVIHLKVPIKCGDQHTTATQPKYSSGEVNNYMVYLSQRDLTEKYSNKTETDLPSLFKRSSS